MDVERGTDDGVVAGADLDPDGEDGRQREQRAVLGDVAQRVELWSHEVVKHARVRRRALETERGEPRRELRVVEDAEQGAPVQSLDLCARQGCCQHADV